MNNQYILLLSGMTGGGKTTATKLLANSVEGGVAVQTSSRLFAFLDSEGLSLKEINNLPIEQREIKLRKDNALKSQP